MSRIASTVHALLSCVASVISTYYLCGLGDECMMKPQLFRSRALAFSAGYFAYDLCVCRFLLKPDKMTLAHHFISLSGSVLSVYVGEQYPGICLMSYFTEISNPVVNYRSMLLQGGMGATALFKANLYAMGALFLVFRVFFYPIGIYRLYIGY